MKHITIKDIAQKLSLSVSTVSRALTCDKNIRRETRDMVLEAAREMGYKRNPVATNLKYGHTNTVGVIVPEMVTPYAAKVIAGIQDVLYRGRIKVIIASSDESAEKEREALAMMDDFMVDGIIACICSYRENRDEFHRLIREGLPIVCYDRIPREWDVPQVTIDDYMKAFVLVERLIRGGRRNICHLAGPEGIYNSAERIRGYRDAMTRYGLTPCVRPTPSPRMTFADGAQWVDTLRADGVEMDGLFAFTDTLAIGAMNRLKELGVRIPEQVAVAGFSGTELATIVHPALTTVEPPLFDMGREAANLIMEMLDRPDAPRRTLVLDAQIVERASTGQAE